MVSMEIKMKSLVDIHSHIRTFDIDDNSLENIHTLSQKAKKAGYKYVCIMPNIKHVNFNDAEYLKINMLSKHNGIQFKYFLPWNIKQSTVDNLNSKMIIGYKIFQNDVKGHLYEFLNNFIKCHNVENKVLAFHVTDNNLAMLLEWHKINKEIRVHICHVPTINDLDLVCRHRDKGYNITCEVAPHHLLSDYLTTNYYKEWLQTAYNVNADKLLRVEPPLNDDAKYLRKRLNDVDIIATDHAPHSLKQKELKDCPGFASLQYAPNIILTMWNNGQFSNISIEDIENKMSTNPAKLLGINIETYELYKLTKPYNIDDKEWSIYNRFPMCFEKCYNE